MNRYTTEKVDKITTKAEKSVKKIARKIKIIAFILGLISFGIMFFLAFYNISKWYDSNQVIFQSPIIIKLQAPIVIEKRNIESKWNKGGLHEKKEVKEVEIKPKTSIESFKKYLTDDGNNNREKALIYLGKYYSGDELISADNILKKEAGYRTDAVNEIGCEGMPQACPNPDGSSKLNCPLNDSGFECQLQWFVGYITRRYGKPTEAWKFHQINNYY